MLKSVPYVRNMVGNTNHTTLMTVVSSIPTVLLSKGMGVQEAQRSGHADKNCSNQRERKGANFAQIICKEVKEAFCKQSHKRTKPCASDSESDSNSNYSL